MRPLHNRVKIKICGLTHPDTVKAFNHLAIDAIGLVFYHKSSRYVHTQQAQQIIDALPPFINKVGLFVNATPEFIRQIIHQTNIDTLQFHGSETQQECEQYNLPYLKAIAMQTNTNLTTVSDNYSSASGLLLDSYHQDNFGGSGKVFDWSLMNQKTFLTKTLAGGLTPENVAEAIKQTNPYAVDVSSGVETNGIKDLDKIQHFIEQVSLASH